jgi:hypothetical protein
VFRQAHGRKQPARHLHKPLAKDGLEGAQLISLLLRIIVCHAAGRAAVSFYLTSI